MIILPLWTAVIIFGTMYFMKKYFQKKIKKNPPITKNMLIQQYKALYPGRSINMKGINQAWSNIKKEQDKWEL